MLTCLFYHTIFETGSRCFESQEEILAPSIILPEISSAISRGTGQRNLALDFCEEIRQLPNFNFVPVDEELAALAAEVAAINLLRGADSIYVALAYKFSCPLATFDTDQKKKAQSIVQLVEL